jgi:hypothetical protein
MGFVLQDDDAVALKRLFLKFFLQRPARKIAHAQTRRPQFNVVLLLLSRPSRGRPYQTLA